MNVNDSAKLSEVLESFGYSSVENSSARWPQFKENLSKCDIILVNTCVVRERAENKALGFIDSLRYLKKVKPGIIIGVCGCMTKQEHINLKERFPFVDLIFGPNEPGKLDAYLVNKLSVTRNEKRVTSKNNYVTIMHGCDNFCSYCVVPYVRGREISRPMDDILSEIKDLIDQGAKEITLLGQNVNSYKYDLANLLMEIEKLFSLPVTRYSLRFMTNHPRDFSDKIIETVAELKCAAKDFHLPLQSGDDEILKKMNRGYTVDYYRGRIKKIKELMPEATITTDIIVGFPGETEEQFSNTLDRIREFKFNAVNMAAYSIRPQTAAAKLPDHLPEEIKKERLKKLIEVVNEVAGKKVLTSLNHHRPHLGISISKLNAFPPLPKGEEVVG